MELFQKSIQDALASNVAEGHRWEAYKNDHLQACENLKNFSEHLELDIMVPVGTKAMIPGTLYNTGVVFVSHYQNYISKCSAHQAGNLCRKRLVLAQERLDALEDEYKRYVSKLEMPFSENAFKSSNNEQEIIEEYDEIKEKEWRMKHRESVKKMKQIEAKERIKDKQKEDKNILDMLDELELIEDLNEELMTYNDNEIREKVQRFNTKDDLSSIEKLNENADDYDEDEENYTDSSIDESIPKEFRKLTRQSKDMSLDDQFIFFKSHSDELQEFLYQSKPTTFEELNKKTDKRVLFDHLKSKLDDLRTEIKRQKKRKQITELNANIMETEHVPVETKIENNESSIATTSPTKPLQKRVSFDGQDQIREFRSDENCNQQSAITFDNETTMQQTLPTSSSSSLTYHLKINHTESKLSDDLNEKLDFTDDHVLIRHPGDIADWHKSMELCQNSSTTLKSILKIKRNIANTELYTKMKPPNTEPLKMEIDSDDNNNNNDDVDEDEDIHKRKEEFNRIMDDMFGEVFQRSEPSSKAMNENPEKSVKALKDKSPINSNNIGQPKKRVSLFKQSRQK